MEVCLKDPLLTTTSSSSSGRPTTPAGGLRRSRTAPSLVSLSAVTAAHDETSSSTSTSLPRAAAPFLLLYLASGIAFYILVPDHFTGDGRSYPLVDALYFSVVSMCTIGYGDITPSSTLSKLFSVAFVLVGFGFVDILLGVTLSRFLDLQEGLILDAANNNNAARDLTSEMTSYIFDAKKGRVRIRLKVGLALAAVVMCVAVGTCALHFVESLDWLDSLYLSVMSVTTVGYGDHAFRTVPGRLFASVWLLFSTLAVARAFLYLAEARVDRRRRRMTKWVLAKDMTLAEFLAADINGDGSVSMSEFVVYKLKEMGKITEQDIAQICRQFRKLDSGNSGKIKLGDLPPNRA